MQINTNAIVAMNDANQNFAKVAHVIEMQHDTLRQKMIDAEADKLIEENREALLELAREENTIAF